MDELQSGDPRQIGPYRVVARLGAGGMGRVYLGQSPGGRMVVIKVIRPELAERPGFRARFARELAAAREVSGTFTAPVVDGDPDGPEPWLATPYVSGPSLDEVVAGHGPLPADRVLALAAELAEGLADIHAAGVVHGDLRPSNVLLAEDGPRLIDFGISRPLAAVGLTGTGTEVGGPGFMSPEQIEGREAGPSSDVFSLGAVLTFAATGQGPFGEGSTAELLYRVAVGAPDTSGLPAEIQPLVERWLEKDPQRRPTAAQVLNELSAIAAGASSRVRGQGRPGPAAAAEARAARQPTVTGLEPPHYGASGAAPPSYGPGATRPGYRVPRQRRASVP